MKKKTLLPIQTAPVVRLTTALTRWGQGSTSPHGGVGAATYCDLETRQCFTFAGDDAE